MLFKKGKGVLSIAFFALLCLIYINLVLSNTDYYKTLGIAKKANEKEIKKAYRKLSMKYHPDTNAGSKDAEKKFQEVAQAYEILTDKEKRKIYDQHGEQGLNKHIQQQQQGGGGGGDPADIFSQFFGRRPQHREAQRGPDVRISIPVTLEDLYIGRVIEVEVEQQVLCPHCRGTGADSDEHFHVCTRCKGQGMVLQVQQIAPGFVQQMQAQCPVCAGKGKVITKECHVCSGKKRQSGTRTLDVYVDNGMKDGQTIEFPHSADEQPDINAGHVVFVIEQLKHVFYTRENNDLKCEIKISLKESLTGFERYLTHLDGHKVFIKRTSVTKPHSVIKVKDGMVDEKGDKGTLHVKIIVDFPAQLNEQQKNVLTSFF